MAGGLHQEVGLRESVRRWDSTEGESSSAGRGVVSESDASLGDVAVWTECVANVVKLTLRRFHLHVACACVP